MDITAFRISAPTTGQVILLIVIFFVVALVFFIASRSAVRTSSKRKGKFTTGASWHNFYQLAKMRGLTRQETEVLRRLVISYGLNKPALVFTSTPILDGCIQRAIKRTSIKELKGESKDDVINLYYRIRNKITRNRAIRGIATTKSIPVGAKLRIEAEKAGIFSVKVVRNDDECFGINIPILSPGKMIAWGKMKLKCSYWRENDAAYVFETKISDVIIDDNEQLLCLKHTNKVSRIQKRRYPRKNVRLPVLFVRLRIIEQGGKKKAIVDRRDAHWGTIVDISVGGMSIETTSPVDKNNYIKIEFELKEDYKVVGIGKVRRIERNPAKKNWIMHIQYTKMDKRYKNEIFALLYDYETI